MRVDDESAVDELIAEQPHNIAALIRKADIRAGAGDDRIAVSFYKAALKVAAARGATADFAAELTRAQAACDQAAIRFQEYLEAGLASAGLTFANRPPRFQESLEILMGRKQPMMELQRPQGYYFPGLPQRRYYERSEFDWATELESQTDAIRGEALTLAEDASRFTPYLVSDRSRPPRQYHGLLDNPNWSTLELWDNGAPVTDNVERCPRTYSALKGLDLSFIAKRSPWVVFSKLKPGAHIPPHTGIINARLICHLPLVVPGDCAFRVGGEVRPWREGELMVFDDTVEHEAWNNGSHDRIVLIFDIWRPEVTADERRAIATMFEIIDAYG